MRTEHADPYPASAPDGTRRVSPTDVTQFIRLEQCARFLRLRLHSHNADRGFMRRYGVEAQRIPPLLTRSGGLFEQENEAAISGAIESVSLFAGSKRAGDRPPDNDRVVHLARELRPGQTLVLFQPRLEVDVAGWLMRGDLDVLRLERDGAGTLRALIADMKASAAVKVEYRLQVAFYREMLAALFHREGAREGVPCAAIGLGVLYRGPRHAPETLEPEEAARLAREREQAVRLLGAPDAHLELVEDVAAYADAVRDLVTAPDSVAARVADAPLGDVPYHLAPKCDMCLWNAFCMKWSVEHDDLSLLPHLTAPEKTTLLRRGVAHVRDLAGLKLPAPDDPRELLPAPGREDEVRALATAWPVGPRLDELVHRARRSRRQRADPEFPDALSGIPSKGYGSLPYAAADHNPNLVRVYIDAQHDYLHDRVYMLSALVSACAGGEPDPARRARIVRMTPGPPDSPERERELLVGWIRDLTEAIVEHAAPDAEGERRAPIHLIFYDGREQRVLLEALGRHLDTVLGATPLYDFVTQLAAYDSPVATFLLEEIRELKNYPMVCQSLESVATWLRFDWNAPEPYRRLFRERLFDATAKRETGDGREEWYTSRARFGSQIPLEYAYAAWGELEADGREARAEQYQAYRGATQELLHRFQTRRLEALEHVARDFRGNHITTKTAFALPDLAAFEESGRSLADAIREFVQIERHVELAAWKRARLAPPERRVLSGDTLLARYAEADQDVDVRTRNRRNLETFRERERLWEERRGAAGGEAELSKEEKARLKWDHEGMRVRLRLDCAGADCDADEALRMTNLKEGDGVIVYPRWTVDGRLPTAERTPHQPTPRQMLYGARGQIERIDARAGSVEVAMRHSHGVKEHREFAFPSTGARPFEPDEQYTLDEDPNNWMGYWGAKVAEGLANDQPNTLYARLARPAHVPSPAWPPEARAGQARFLRGLDALDAAGLLHPFEPEKRAYIGGHGETPTLLVQGPPGTGKSYTSGYALLARLQGAMAAGLPYRALVSAKTHVATDVLLRGVADALEHLTLVRNRDRTLFDAHFDARLLDVPVYRFKPRAEPPRGTTELADDPDGPRGRKKAADRLAAREWAVVGATPGGVYKLVTERWSGKPFGHELAQCLVLDEASQLSLPEAAMAALPLASRGHLIVVGDHRQMPPIVHHDWTAEPRRTFKRYRTYESLFLALLPLVGAGVIRFAESFRLHAEMAEFLRREVYVKDNILFRSGKRDVLPPIAHPDPYVRAVLAPERPLVVVVHDERGSQRANPFESELIRPVLEALGTEERYGRDPREGIGIVVPHRAQRAELQAAAPSLVVRDPETDAVRLSAVDTVERFQGGERRVVLVSATESDREYLLAASEFLLDPRRLTVALSRAKEKMVLVASRSVFELFSADEETFAHAQIWKNLLRHTCTALLWEGVREGVRVQVWGNKPTAESAR